MHLRWGKGTAKLTLVNWRWPPPVKSTATLKRAKSTLTVETEPSLPKTKERMLKNYLKVPRSHFQVCGPAVALHFLVLASRVVHSRTGASVFAGAAL